MIAHDLLPDVLVKKEEASNELAPVVQKVMYTNGNEK